LSSVRAGVFYASVDGYRPWYLDARKFRRGDFVSAAFFAEAESRYREAGAS
jgi:hypothetical protein